MGRSIVLTAADGHEFGAYEAQPAGPVRGRLVVIQEAFGVTSHIRNECERYAGEGYQAVAPALYDRIERGLELGHSADDFKKARALHGRIDREKMLLDVRAAADHLGPPGTLGVVGYCFGGYVAWLAACRLEMACAADFYGGSIDETVGEKPKCPTACHFGEKDHLIPLEDVEKVRATHPEVSVFLYPAGHGFMCEERENYHAESAAIARQRALAFLAEHLK